MWYAPHKNIQFIFINDRSKLFKATNSLFQKQEKVDSHC